MKLKTTRKSKWARRKNEKLVFSLFSNKTKLSFDKNLTYQTPLIWKWNFSQIKNYETTQNNLTQNQVYKTKMAHEIVVDKWVSLAKKATV
jgi:hypothetical protein